MRKRNPKWLATSNVCVVYIQRWRAFAHDWKSKCHLDVEARVVQEIEKGILTRFHDSFMDVGRELLQLRIETSTLRSLDVAELLQGLTEEKTAARKIVNDGISNV